MSYLTSNLFRADIPWKFIQALQFYYRCSCNYVNLSFIQGSQSDLTPQNLQDLRRAFDLTQDSGVVDQYGAKKMLQIFNMNPTTEEVTRRYVEHDKDVSAGLTFDEFEKMFHDYLKEHEKVPDALSDTLCNLFDGPVAKDELRKILTEMGSEPLEPEETDEVINEIPFDENGTISQGELKEFLMNRVVMSPQAQQEDNTQVPVIAQVPDTGHQSPEVASDQSEDEF